MNIYVLVALILLLGFILGRILRRLRLTEILAYIIAGIVIARVLNYTPPEQFNVIITGVTLALVAYIIGLNFSFAFLKRMGKQLVIILFVQVFMTFLATWGFVYLPNGGPAPFHNFGFACPRDRSGRNNRSFTRLKGKRNTYRYYHCSCGTG